MHDFIYLGPLCRLAQSLLPVEMYISDPILDLKAL